MTNRTQFLGALRPVQNQARQTVRVAGTTVQRAERRLTSVLLDTAYASVGATDSALAVLRALPGRADRLADRGREVVGTIRKSEGR